jgi:hypothetical protein
MKPYSPRLAHPFFIDLQVSFSLLLLFLLDIFFFLMQLSRCMPLGSARSLGAGGDNEIRTRDLLLARQALSQLSYAPVGFSGTGPEN